MPPRDQIMNFVATRLASLVQKPDDIWVAIYILLLDYANGVPRITDSNRLKPGSIWFHRAQIVEQKLARVLRCSPADVSSRVDVFLRTVYPPNTQRMNPVGIALACSTVYLINRFASGKYDWKMEAKIGKEIFPTLTNFRCSTVDIVASQSGSPYAVISSKWGMRHDRIRDPQEEADTYKQHEPSLQFYVLTNEFDNGRLQHLINYPAIDGVFHINKNLVQELYGGNSSVLVELKDFTDLLFQHASAKLCAFSARL